MSGHDDDIGAAWHGARGTKYREATMAIEWNCERCSAPLPVDKVDTANRDALIFVGVNLSAGWELTPENLGEWFVRWRIEERLCGVKPDSWFEGGADLASVLHRWVGLKLNGGDIPRGEWLTRRLAGWIEDAECEWVEMLEQRSLQTMDALADRLFNG